MLTTAGGLVFVGTMDRYFRAHDDRSGKILWETRLNDVPNAFPITYAVDGKQYIAMIAGYSGSTGEATTSALYRRSVHHYRRQTLFCGFGN